MATGEDGGVTEVSLAKQNLTSIPDSVRSLKALKKIDCAHNPSLVDLPEWISELTELDIAFFLSCGFTTIPRQLVQFPHLRMLSLKSCHLAGELSCSMLPPTIEWLILTGNRLDSISSDVADRLPKLRKVMLSHNQLQKLPGGMASLQSMELLRISGNRFSNLPVEFITSAAQRGLKWLAMAGNPCSVCPPVSASSLPVATLPELGVDVNSAPLGKGASGVVYAGRWEGGDVAVKVFSVGKEAVAALSDGRPEDEIAACACACGDGAKGLIRVRALLKHPEIGAEGSHDAAAGDDPKCLAVRGVVFDVYAESQGWFSLGNPPSMASTTRDSYTPAQLARIQEGGPESALQRALRACGCVAAAVAQLQVRGFVHGDVYAHNTLLRAADGEAVLVDLGAAFFVGAPSTGLAGLGGVPPGAAEAYADARASCFRLDVAALAVMAEEVLSLSQLPSLSTTTALSLDEVRALHPPSALDAVRATAVAAASGAGPGPGAQTVEGVCRRLRACVAAEEALALLRSLSVHAAL